MWICQVKVLEDSRPVLKRVTDSFLSTFFPTGYPYRLDIIGWIFFIVTSKKDALAYLLIFFFILQCE